MILKIMMMKINFNSIIFENKLIINKFNSSNNNKKMLKLYKIWVIYVKKIKQKCLKIYFKIKKILI